MLRHHFSALDSTERTFASAVVNCFGNGQHPCAQTENLEFFSSTYVAECAQKAAQSGDLNPDGLYLASRLAFVLAR